jgi:hypothetical protein
MSPRLERVRIGERRDVSCRRIDREPAVVP